MSEFTQIKTNYALLRPQWETLAVVPYWPSGASRVEGGERSSALNASYLPSGWFYVKNVYYEKKNEHSYLL